MNLQCMFQRISPAFQKPSMVRCCLWLTLFTVLTILPNALASESGSLGNFLKGGFSTALHEDMPLYTPECKSPHQTLKNFFRILREIKEVMKEGRNRGEVLWSQEKKLTELYARLTYLLDISSIPENDQFAVTHIIDSQLSEILDRIEVPPLNEIPKEAALKEEKVDFWRFPHHAEISLSRIKKGPRSGDWVFSADTIKQTDRFYDRVKHLPYRKDANVGLIDEDGGLLEHYIKYTGPWIPSRFTVWLPSWLKKRVLWDPLWKYLATLLTIFAVIGAAFLIYRLTRFESDRKADPNRIWVHVRRIVLPISLAVVILMAIHFITIDIRLRLLPLKLADGLLWTIFYVIGFWVWVCMGNLVAALIIKLPAVSPWGLDSSLVRLFTRILAYFAGFWTIFEGIQNLGLSFVPLIAGVSVGGLAFALAARPTLGNLLAGVLLFADKPFSAGQRVVIGKHDGIVEDIGLRSTRIRTLDGHQITVPNEEVSNNDIINITRRPNIRRKFNLTITYDTPPEKIGRAIEIIRGLLSVDEDGAKSEEELGRPSNERINSKAFPIRVFFNELNSDSLNILVTYWFAPPDYLDYLAHATWVNTQLIERFGREGIKFAFPTQTIELETSTTDGKKSSPSVATNPSPIQT